MPAAADADSHPVSPSPSAPSLQQHLKQQRAERRNRKRPRQSSTYQPSSPSRTSPSPSVAAADDYDNSDRDSASETAAAERATKAHLSALLRGYCIYSSTRQWRTWSEEIFAEDAVLSFEFFGKLRGRNEIFCGAVGMTQFRFTKGFFSEVHLDLDPLHPDERATGTAHLWYERPDEAPKAPETLLSAMSIGVDAVKKNKDPTANCDYCGPYEFEFVKTDEGWKINSMSLKVLSDHREEVDKLCTRCDYIPLSTCGTPCR